MRDLIINSSAQYTLLLVVPFILAVILKWTKIRAWSMAGGLVGGILLGPAVLGSVAPTYWEGIFQGGVSEREELTYLDREQQADILAATTRGVDQNLILQMRADQLYARSISHEKWQLATWEDQRTLRNFSIALVVLVLLCGNDRRAKRKTYSDLNSTDHAPLSMSLSVGAWSSVLPGGCIAVISYLFWDASLAASLAIGACLGAGPWTLSRWEQRTADGSETGGAMLMLRCGRVAWCIAGGAAIYAVWQEHGAMSLVWLLPVLLLPVMWMIPPRDGRLLRWLVDFAAIPSVVATSLVLISPIDAFQLWPMLIVILLCADARWLGGVVGLGILGGRTSADAMRLSIPLVDAGVSQLCMVTLLFGAGVLTAPLAFAIIIGALFLEITAPIRFKFTTVTFPN